MYLVLNRINGRYFRDILENSVKTRSLWKRPSRMRLTTRLCFEWCWKNEISLKYWGRFDDTIPVSLPILKTFLSRRSRIFTCKLIRRFHAKVIWWHGDGAYVGSANHTGAAWNSNVEAGTLLR